MGDVLLERFGGAGDSTGDGIGCSAVAGRPDLCPRPPGLADSDWRCFGGLMSEEIRDKGVRTVDTTKIFEAV
jgi:hypothetical protein